MEAGVISESNEAAKGSSVMESGTKQDSVAKESESMEVRCAASERRVRRPTWRAASGVRLASGARRDTEEGEVCVVRKTRGA
jgi:hypothetical protein